MHKRLYAAAFAVLIAGVGAGLAIYALSDAPDPGADEIVLSKQYSRELQRFGGKMSVLFADLSREFAALWRGKALGATIAWLSILASAGLFLAAWRLAGRDGRAPPRKPPPD